MRPLEIFLIVICAAWLLLPNIRRWRRVLGAGILAGFVLHVFIEGVRWHLVGAYFVGGALLFSLWKNSIAHAPATSGWRYAQRASGLLALITAAIVSMLMGVPQSPSLSGSYQVSTVSYHWIDTARGETYTTDPLDRRELMVQFFYPTDTSPGVWPAPYIEHGSVKGVALMEAAMSYMGYGGGEPPSFLMQIGKFPFLADHVALARLRAMQGAPLSTRAASYPVLIFSHGLGSVREQSNYLLQDLASQGYIVISIEHTYDAALTVFPDGRVVPFQGYGLPEFDERVSVWASDILFVIDQLERLNGNSMFAAHLDLARLGVFGYSLGGAASVQTCWVDRRCQATMDIDGSLWGDIDLMRLEQPVMFIHNRYGPNRDQNLVYQAAKTKAYRLTVAGAVHPSFTEVTYFTPITQWLGMTGDISAVRSREIVRDYTQAFFNKHLKNESAPLLEGTVRYPEVKFESRLGER